MLKIVITGPESTGKSTLAKQLAAHFNAQLVDEFARTYLTNLGRAYTQSDLLIIAKGQIKAEYKAIADNPTLLICDTSLEVIKIWSEFKYGSCDPFITNGLSNNLPDLYLLMTPDLPWQPDPLRENPDDRDQIFELYKKELKISGVPFYKIWGNEKERFKMAKEVIEKNSPEI